MRHHRRRLLMTHVNQPYTKSLGMHRQKDIRPAHDVEDSINAFFLESFSH
jgi:hypothetical protein